MADRRQAELSRELAARPPQWALNAWGVPPAEAGALRDDWEKQAAIVGAYRELAGITDPAQAIGPVPSGQPDLAETFHAAVQALRLPDDAALLKAMGRGELEAQVDAHDRALALTPADVQADIDQRAAEFEDAQVSAHTAGDSRDAQAQADAETRAQDAAADLARLAVADAARREWTEAHAESAAQAEAAARELRERGLAGRITETESAFLDRLHQMVTGTEATPEAQAETEAEARPTPEAESEAGFLERLAQVRAEAEARQAAQAEAAAEPQAQAGDIDPELVRQAGEDLDAEPVRAQFLDDMAEIRTGTERVGELVDAMPDRQAGQRAQLEQEIRDEPRIRPQAEAEPSLESSWQPGNAPEASAPQAEADYEAEIEM